MEKNAKLKRIPGIETILTPDMHSITNGVGPLYNYFFPTIKAGLNWLAERCEEQNGMHVEVKNGGGPIMVDRDTNFILFGSASILLSRICEYSRAKNVLISLEKNGKGITVSVEEDGIGFDAADTDSLLQYSKEHELTRINDHLRFFGGHLAVESRKDAGTRVSVTVPTAALN
ncbi:MAG: hypothetical protein JXO48_00580 [Deltaproteobacteria bacterium]|nr:hypothetical protein [Deltaproteobacteria bacterium]